MAVVGGADGGRAAVARMSAWSRPGRRRLPAPRRLALTGGGSLLTDDRGSHDALDTVCIILLLCFFFFFFSLGSIVPLPAHSWMNVSFCSCAVVARHFWQMQC